MSDARDYITAPRFPGQPVKCPECGKPFSDARIKHHLATVHKIGTAHV